MATSGIYTLAQTTNQTVQEALEILQVSGDGETLSGNMYGRARTSLNTMLQSWNTGGIHLWTETEGTLFLEVGRREYDTRISTNRFVNTWFETTTTAATVAAATSVTLTKVTDIQDTDNIGIIQNDNNTFWTTVNGVPDTVAKTVQLTDPIPLATVSGAFTRNYRLATSTTPSLKPIARVTDVRRDVRGSDYEIPIVFDSRQEYFGLPNKTSQGTVVQVYYSKQDVSGEVGGIFYTWLTPDSSNDVINFTYERMIQIQVDTGDTLDVPDWALDCVNWNLAERLIPKFGCSAERAIFIKAKAKELMNDLMAFDTESYPIKIRMPQHG